MKGDAHPHLSPLRAGHSEILCFKSWTAYVRPTALAAAAVLIAVAALASLESASLTFMVVVSILGVYAGSVLSLQQEMLMIDDEGVWHCRGGPGAKPRMVGVRWPYVRCSLSRRRIDWPRTSSTVVIRNRMTCREIRIKHMAHGDLAIERIGKAQQMCRHDPR